MLQEVIVDVITGIVKLVKTSREALAATLEEIADKVRNGALIPDAAFKRAKATRDETKSARDKLPK